MTGLALAAALLATPAGGFKDGGFYEVEIPYGSNVLEFVTGRTFPVENGRRQEAERMVISTVFPKDLAEASGLKFAPRYEGVKWGADREYFLNPKMAEKDFSSMDNIARWQESVAVREHRDPSKETARIGVRIDREAFRFFCNGAYVISLQRDGETPVSSAGFRPGKKNVIPESVEEQERFPGFLPLDISERVNSAGFTGGRLKTPGTGPTFEFGGVPFLRPRHPKYDNVDLSMSWVPAATRTGFSACHSWLRWTKPLEKIPLRYAFRFPAEDVDAMYVLCATDGRKKDALPRFTVQFYRRNADQYESGRPISFTSETVPVSTNNSLYLVKIPLSGDLITEHGGEEAFNLELTKDVHPYRTYADPLNHSIHAGGLPSAVRVFGVTFGRAAVKTSFDPDRPANVFTEGEKVSYTVRLENTTAETREVKLAFETCSYDGSERHDDDDSVELEPGERKSVTFSFSPARFGWHRVKLACNGRTYNRTCAYLRARTYEARPWEAKGMRFGQWKMLRNPVYTEVCGKAGFDTVCPYDAKPTEEVKAKMREYGYRVFFAPGSIFAQGDRIRAGMDFKEACDFYEKRLPPAHDELDEFRDARYVAALAEPGGIGTENAGFPEYFGEPENAYDYAKLEGTRRQRYEDYKFQMKVARHVLLKRYPGVKFLCPHGGWNFMIPFLQDPEMRNFSDGAQMDFQYYTRLPEQQIHQSTLHSIWFMRNAWKKYRTDRPLLIWSEGPDVTQVYPGGSTEEMSAAHHVRISAIMAAYGVDMQLSWGVNPVSIGENHCQGSLITGKHAMNPDVAYAAFAAWTRKTRYATFESVSKPGSLSAYCLNFRDHRTGRLFRVIWTIRGTREFVFDVPPRKLEVYDPMDNVVEAVKRDGKSVITVGQMPYVVYGADEVEPTLGAFDHSDARPAGVVRKLGDLGDLVGEQTSDADDLYVNMMPAMIRRFQAKMDVTKTTDPEEPGSLVSVKIGAQARDRMTMPYFTCLPLKKPVTIEGKASRLTVRVKAASDWGRIVFVLKDASNRRWYSVGRAGDWNGDDMPGDSTFCFDGWRLLKYDLPSCLPWDCFRELGMTCWGSDSLHAPIELPLSLEKIFVERRNGAMYGNGFERIPEDKGVLLGALSVEYDSAEYLGKEAIRLSLIRAPELPASSLPDTIAEMTKAGTLAPGRITGVRDPDQWYDGTRGLFAYEVPAEAVSVDFWLSLNEEGKGAHRLLKGWKQGSPAYVQGFVADTTFWAYLVWTDKDGNVSKPSAPFKFRLVDHFGHQ